MAESLGFREGAAVSIEPAGDGVLIRPLHAAPTAEERRDFLDALDRAHAALRADPAEWEREPAERRALDGLAPADLEAVAEARLAGWLAEDTPAA